MKRDEKLIKNILGRVESSRETTGNIGWEESESRFHVSEDVFEFHARLLVSDGFIKGEFSSSGMYFYGLTTAGFDYYEHLKTPVRSFFRSLFR